MTGNEYDAIVHAIVFVWSASSSEDQKLPLINQLFSL
jgi:hypothetical protein